MQRAQLFTHFASAVSRWMARPAAFIACCVFVVVWALSGPIFRYSDTWQLVVNTATTIITFLMVFLIQNAQYRDTAAIQAKLDEIIQSGASDNKYIGIERLTDEELEAILVEVERNATKLHNERERRRPSEAAAGRRA